MSTTLIPPVYPNNDPIDWQGETSGRLGLAVTHYFYYNPTQEPEDHLSLDEVHLLRDYMLHWVNCPSMIFQAGVKESLVAKLNGIQSRQDVTDAIHACLEQGVDPF